MDKLEETYTILTEPNLSKMTKLIQYHVLMTSSTHTSKMNLTFGTLSGVSSRSKIVVDTSIKIIIHGMQFRAASWKQINRMQIHQYNSSPPSSK